ncbi:type VI secretion system tube protein TssD [Lacinutrix salivirga]
MSFLAKLTIDDQVYNILSYSFEIDQHVPYGAARPGGLPIIRHLHLTIESNSDDTFFTWSIFPHDQKDGEIIFYKRDAMASSRKLNFTGAYCVNYTEKFESNSVTPMIMGITLSVEMLTLNDSAEYVNPENRNF